MSSRRCVLLDQDGSQLTLCPGFIAPEEAAAALRHLCDNIPWTRHPVRMFGRELPSPRLSCWMGEPEASYRYSGHTHLPLPWQAPLPEWRRRLEQATAAEYNSVLLNWYRDGNDYMGWHADAEPELGTAPTIASLSLGAGRDFTLKPRVGRGPRIVVPLHSGDLLVMAGRLQQDWLHALPKRQRVLAPRINLTWRRIFVRQRHKPGSRDSS